MRRDSPSQRMDTRTLPELSDGELLSCFLATNDEAAFAALVGRYKRMVLWVCLRMLHHRQDAEDACQATFVVLMRKASSLREGERISCWLHGVVLNEARNIRKRKRRRKSHEGEGDLAHLADKVEVEGFRELQTQLEQEAQRLPEKYRVPFMLFYREGKSKIEVARKLGKPEGTISSRLARARELLRRRLRMINENTGR